MDKRHKRAVILWKSWIFFIIGVIPAICFRIIAIAQHYSPLWAKIFWYAAVVGNLIFFWFVYDISLKRYKLITVEDLDKKVEEKAKLSEADYKNLHYILTSLIVSKERLNYFVIFLASVISLAIAIYLDFVK